MSVTKVNLTAPTQFSDGSAISAAQAATLTYKVFIDTVNPPVKFFNVPAANAPTAPGQAVSVTFVQLGFTPASNTLYFVDATDTFGTTESVVSNQVSFTIAVAPNPPGAVSVG